MELSDRLKEFVEALKGDEALQDEVAACETSREIVEAARARGYEVTMEEVEQAAKGEG